MDKTIPSWIKINPDQSITLYIHAQPGAKREGVVGVYGDKLKIALSTPPVDGKANKALVTFFSRQLGIPKKNVQIVSGDFSREKKISIHGLTLESVLLSLSQ